MTKKKNICPVCKKEYLYALKVLIVDGEQSCEHDNPNTGPTGKPSLDLLSKIGRDNEKKSSMALQMAMDRKRMDRVDKVGEMENVVSFQDGPNKGRTMQIPKSVIESIKEKTEEAL